MKSQEQLLAETLYLNIVNIGERNNWSEGKIDKIFRERLDSADNNLKVKSNPKLLATRITAKMNVNGKAKSGVIESIGVMKGRYSSNLSSIKHRR